MNACAKTATPVPVEYANVLLADLNEANHRFVYYFFHGTPGSYDFIEGAKAETAYKLALSAFGYEVVYDEELSAYVFVD